MHPGFGDEWIQYDKIRDFVDDSVFFRKDVSPSGSDIFKGKNGDLLPVYRFRGLPGHDNTTFRNSELEILVNDSAFFGLYLPPEWCLTQHSAAFVASYPEQFPLINALNVLEANLVQYLFEKRDEECDQKNRLGFRQVLLTGCMYVVAALMKRHRAVMPMDLLKSIMDRVSSLSDVDLDTLREWVPRIRFFHGALHEMILGSQCMSSIYRFVIQEFHTLIGVRHHNMDDTASSVLFNGGGVIRCLNMSRTNLRNLDTWRRMPWDKIVDPELLGVNRDASKELLTSPSSDKEKTFNMIASQKIRNTRITFNNIKLPGFTVGYAILNCMWNTMELLADYRIQSSLISARTVRALLASLWRTQLHKLLSCFICSQGVLMKNYSVVELLNYYSVIYPTKNLGTRAAMVRNTFKNAFRHIPQTSGFSGMVETVISGSDPVEALSPLFIIESFLMRKYYPIPTESGGKNLHDRMELAERNKLIASKESMNKLTYTEGYVFLSELYAFVGWYLLILSLEVDDAKTTTKSILNSSNKSLIETILNHAGISRKPEMLEDNSIGVYSMIALVGLSMLRNAVNVSKIRQNIVRECLPVINFLDGNERVLDSIVGVVREHLGDYQSSYRNLLKIMSKNGFRVNAPSSVLESSNKSSTFESGKGSRETVGSGQERRSMLKMNMNQNLPNDVEIVGNPVGHCSFDNHLDPNHKPSLPSGFKLVITDKEVENTNFLHAVTIPLTEAEIRFQRPGL